MIRILPPTIPLAEVRRLLGYPPGHAIPERVQSLLDTLLAEAPSLLEPRGASARFALADAAAVHLPLPAAEGALSDFALGIVTIGPRLEDRVTAALNAGDATEALLLDTIGSAAVEAAADALGSLLARTGGGGAGGPDDECGPAFGPRSGSGSPGCAISGARHSVPGLAPGPDPAPPPCRISPGYGGWPLSAQESIFARLPHDTIGVRLLPSMLMVPRKSITFALWFDPGGRAIAGRGGCSGCELERCPRRSFPQRGDSA